MFSCATETQELLCLTTKRVIKNKPKNLAYPEYNSLTCSFQIPPCIDFRVSGRHDKTAAHGCPHQGGDEISSVYLSIFRTWNF